MFLNNAKVEAGRVTFAICIKLSQILLKSSQIDFSASVCLFERFESGAVDCGDLTCFILDHTLYLKCYPM